ncbi:MAG TPA: aspartyl/asparaginyl beta-hydroxylase domain-containing protein [Sphingomicrobium sp.]
MERASHYRPMQIGDQQADTLFRDGANALQQGRTGEARRQFERLTAAGRANAQVWLYLAVACRAEQDHGAEEAALDQLLAIEPRAVRARILKGDCRYRAGDEPDAARFYQSALRLAQGQRLPDELRTELRRAEAALGELERRIEERREATLTEQGLPPGSRSARFQQALDISAGRKEIYLQQPTKFYFPGLPQVQFYDRDDFAWAAAVEAETSAIRDELKLLLKDGVEGFRPYIRTRPGEPRLDSNPLADSIDWSALFLAENGSVSDELIARCPRTWAAVQQAPLQRSPGVGPTVMFSLLRPRARIKAHTGQFNTRLTCHLPLIVPPGCRFRVGNEVREWEEGRLLVFDDSVEHEAWNDGAEDRFILIFDIWRPELSEQEKRELQVYFGVLNPRA